MLFWCLCNKLRTYFWSLRRSLFLLKFQAFHVNSCERLWGGVCFQHQAMTESIFSKASGLSYKWQCKSLQWRFRWSLLLVFILGILVIVSCSREWSVTCRFPLNFSRLYNSSHTSHGTGSGASYELCLTYNKRFYDADERHC